MCPFHPRWVTVSHTQELMSRALKAWQVFGWDDLKQLPTLRFCNTDVLEKHLEKHESHYKCKEL